MLKQLSALGTCHMHCILNQHTQTYTHQILYNFVNSQFANGKLENLSGIENGINLLSNNPDYY